MVVGFTKNGFLPLVSSVSPTLSSVSEAWLLRDETGTVSLVFYEKPCCCLCK